jgi:hypothetical protein
MAIINGYNNNGVMAYRNNQIINGVMANNQWRNNIEIISAAAAWHPAMAAALSNQRLWHLAKA